MDEQALNEKYPGRKVYRDGDRIIVRIPVQFRRRNGRQMIVAADEESTAGPDDNAPAVAIARAWQWQEELESGKHASIEDLARAKKVDRTYAQPDLETDVAGRGGRARAESASVAEGDFGAVE